MLARVFYYKPFSGNSKVFRETKTFRDFVPYCINKLTETTFRVKPSFHFKFSTHKPLARHPVNNVREIHTHRNNIRKKYIHMSNVLRE